MKKSFLGVVVLAVFIVVVVLGAGRFLDSIVKKGLETTGSKITQVSVKVDAVSFLLLNGSARVKGLIVGNPQGFKTPQAIRVVTAGVKVNPRSIFSDKIVVRSVLVEAPEITFEGGLGDNNLSKIMDNMKATAKDAESASTNTTVKAAGEPGRRIEVDDLLITGAKVQVSFAALGGKELTLPLPAIHLTNLGKDSAGITASDLTRRVLDAIITATIKTVANANIDPGKGPGRWGREAGKAVVQGLDKISKDIGVLFKK